MTHQRKHKRIMRDRRHFNSKNIGKSYEAGVKKKPFQLEPINKGFRSLANKRKLTTRQKWEGLMYGMYKSKLPASEKKDVLGDVFTVDVLKKEKVRPKYIKMFQEMESGVTIETSSSFSAGEVLKQLGGNKFIAMTGAKDFFKDDAKQMCGFKIGRNSKSINYVRITLNSMDTYDMEFIMIRGNKITVRNKVEGVYADQLQDIFTEYTGMYTSLGTMGR